MQLFNTNKDILADLIKGKPDDTLLDNALKLQFSSLAYALQNQREGLVVGRHVSVSSFREADLRSS